MELRNEQWKNKQTSYKNLRVKTVHTTVWLQPITIEANWRSQKYYFLEFLIVLIFYYENNLL